MKRKMIFVNGAGNADEITNKLDSGNWFLDPSMYVSGGKAQPMRIEGLGAIYHLINYTDEELEQIEKDIQANKESNKIVSIKSVNDHNKADELIQKGYTLLEDKIYSGKVILILYAKDVQEETDDLINEDGAIPDVATPEIEEENKVKKKYLTPDS
jgi:hypothetical protein